MTPSLLKANFFLLSAALFWGITFIAQKTAMESMGPFTFTGVRFLLGATCLFPIYYFQQFSNKSTYFTNFGYKIFYKFGFILGLLLFLGMNLQQIGLKFTNPTHSSLLTSTYVFFVPLLLFFYKKKIPNYVWWIGVMIITGIYLLTFEPNHEPDMIYQQANQIFLGDTLSLGGAVIWAFHIIWLKNFLNRKISPISLVLSQSFWAGIISLAFAFILEEPTLSILFDHKLEFLIGGVFSIALGFSFQAIGQKNTNSTIAAIILSTESLFASLADYIFLGQVLSAFAYLGGFLIFLGIVLIQIWSVIILKILSFKNKFNFS